MFLTEQDGMDIDHINRNKHDNRLENLRYVSKSQNRTNTPCLPGNRLKEKNISLNQSGCFCVRIFREGKYVFIKNFKTLPEAKEARDFFIRNNY